MRFQIPLSDPRNLHADDGQILDDMVIVRRHDEMVRAAREDKPRQSPDELAATYYRHKDMVDAFLDRVQQMPLPRHGLGARSSPAAGPGSGEATPTPTPPAPAAPRFRFRGPQNPKVAP